MGESVFVDRNTSRLNLEKGIQDRKTHAFQGLFIQEKMSSQGKYDLHQRVDVVYRCVN